MVSLFDEGTKNSIKIDVFTNEIVNTSAIEGEKLSRENVRSSIRKKLDPKHLHKWHKVFIGLGVFRDYDDMQIVSVKKRSIT